MPKNPFAIYDTSPVKNARVDRTIEKNILDAAPETAKTTVRKLGLPITTVSLKGFITVLCVLCSILMLRIFFLQIVKGEEYREQADQNRKQIITIPAMRGVIFDSTGKTMVKNIPNFTLTVNGNDLPIRTEKAIENAAEVISTVIDTPKDEIVTALYDSLINGAPVILRDHIPYTDALALMVQLDAIIGVGVDIQYDRQYNTTEAFSHILGYISKMTQEDYDTLKNDGYLLNDMIGKTGIEYAYEKELRGTYGMQEIEVDFQGRKKNILNEVAPEPGKNIYLSIDRHLQESLYTTVGNAVNQLGLPGGSAVAINPKTGKVLALVSYPGYDNTIFSGEFNQKKYNEIVSDDRNRLLNRAISGTYPSGSVFKPIVAAAALEENIITESTTFLSVGGIKIEGYTYPDWKPGGHGITNVTKALAESVNTFFYYIGGGDNKKLRGLGVERIVAYAEKFGLNHTLGIDLPGEAAGFLPSKNWKEEVKNEPWYLGDTYNLSIGQGDILVTPLQVASYTAAIANGGTLYKPSLVDKITDASNTFVQTMDPVVLNEQVVSKKTIELVEQGMREAVIYGSARSLNTSLPVSSAGKTGTAQFGSEGKTHGWFTVYAPYEDPEIALTVMLEEGKGGNEAALQVAEEVLYEYFTK